MHWLNFTVRAADNGSPPRAAEIPVYLEIVDVNDNNPIFDQSSYQVGGQARKLGPGPVSIAWGLWASSATTQQASEPHGKDHPTSSLMPLVVCLHEFLGQWPGLQGSRAPTFSPCPLGIRKPSLRMCLSVPPF